MGGHWPQEGIKVVYWCTSSSTLGGFDTWLIKQTDVSESLYLCLSGSAAPLASWTLTAGQSKKSDRGKTVFKGACFPIRLALKEGENWQTIQYIVVKSFKWFYLLFWSDFFMLTLSTHSKRWDVHFDPQRQILVFSVKCWLDLIN